MPRHTPSTSSAERAPRPLQLQAHLDSPTVPASPAPVTLSRAHIIDALTRSPDHGATLDLTHLNLSDVGEEGAEELASLGGGDDLPGQSPVVRMALGFNRLAMLPMALALLSSIRYLNLRNNHFTAFPDVLTVMPSLEILDIRRNKLRKFPPQAGTLVNLKVLLLSRNRLSRLPPYFNDFNSLETLAVDHNPLEWPPKNILQPYPEVDDKAVMSSWIRITKTWIADHPVSANPVPGSSQQGWPFPPGGPETPSLPVEPDFEMLTTPHARSFSIDSDVSAYSDVGHPSPTLQLNVKKEASPRPAPLRLGFLPTPGSERAGSSTASARSPDSYLPTPDASVASTEEDDGMNDPQLTAQPAHIRGASFAPKASSSKTNLGVKKSMPDLRMAKFSFGGPPVERGARTRTRTELVQLPEESTTRARATAVPLRRQGTDPLDQIPLASPGHTSFTASGQYTSSPTSITGPAPPVDAERNSYFRRLSTISSSTIHQAIPSSLLTMVEGVRDIMFAVTQIYETLECYAQIAADATLSSVLKQVLSSASAYITRLIGALDRFDNSSRKAMPSPSVCRAVLEGCKDMVGAFGKAVSVLFTQLKVIAANDDKRYTRQMLLILYGSTAEISRAWVIMTPVIDAVRPLLVERHATLRQMRPRVAVNTSADFDSGFDSPLSAPAVNGMDITPTPGRPIPRSRPSLGSDGGSEKIRRARRHAGSFSVKDVELGRTMPSITESPPLPTFIGAGTPTSAQTPTPRATMLSSPAMNILPSSFAHGSPNVYFSSPPHATGAAPPAWANAGLGIGASAMHSRQSSQASLLASSSSAASSPILTHRGNVIPSVGTADALPPSTSTSTMADKDALASVETAIEAAQEMFELIHDRGVGAGVGSEDQPAAPLPAPELQELLTKAKVVTQRLRSQVDAIKGGDMSNAHALRDNHHTFVKVILQLANVMKTFKAATSVRPTMVKLTTATEASLMFLHVSSFPPPTKDRDKDRPSAPAQVHDRDSTGSPSTPVPEAQSPGTLARSRSVFQPPARTPASMAAWHNAPRSALPHQQTFKVTTPPRTASLARQASAQHLGGAGY